MPTENAARILNTTIADYVRGEEVNILRNRKLPALLQKKGRISFNHSGTELDWKIRYARAQITGYADGDSLSFARKNRHKTAKLPWRGYTSSESIGKFEKLQNRGTPAIIKVYTELAKYLMDDMSESFNDELYKDGNATGNTKGIHGLESCFGVGAAAAAGYIYTPSDVYAELNTGLGYYGGNWSQNGSSQVTWPIGTGDPVYDFWSPLILKYTDAAWAGSPDTWRNNCIEVLRFAILHAGKNKSQKGMLDMFTMDREMYRNFQEAYESRQQIYIQRGDKPGGLVALGFGDTINFEGVDITSEYGVPPGVGYGMNVDEMELMSMQDTLFHPDGPDFGIETKSDRFSVDFMGNMKMNPRSMVKLMA